LLFNFALEDAIRRVQVNQVGSKLNVHTSFSFMLMMLIYWEESNIKKNAEALVVASKETGLEVNADKTKYMVMYQDQNAGRSYNIQIDSSSFERVEEFKYLGTTLRDQNSIQEEIKSRGKSGNYSVQILLSCSLPSKNLKIKTYRTIILPVVLYGCETWSLTLREERRLRVFENRVLRGIFGSKRDEAKLQNEELHDLYSSPNTVWVINRKGDGRGM